MSKRPGFLLIEILIALSIFVCISVVIALYQNNIVYWHYEARAYAQATTIGSNFIEKVLLRGSLPQTSATEIGDYTVKMRQINAPFFHGTEGVGLTHHFLKNFNVFEVAISWNTMAGKMRTITLTTACMATSEKGLA